jgi:hypothetical protein
LGISQYIPQYTHQLLEDQAAIFRTWEEDPVKVSRIFHKRLLVSLIDQEAYNLMPILTEQSPT